MSKPLSLSLVATVLTLSIATAAAQTPAPSPAGAVQAVPATTAAPAGTAAPAAAPATPRTPPDTVLLRNGDVVVLQSDYDTAVDRAPENLRGGFGTDPSRVNTLLQQLLTNKTMAAAARKAGLDKEPAIAGEIIAQTDKLLAAAMVEHTADGYRKEFDALPNTEQTARERWVVNADKYRAPGTYTLFVIVFKTPEFSPEDARQAAVAARAKIGEMGDMNALAKELVAQYGNKVDVQTRGPAKSTEWEPAIARTVERFEKVGNVSAPVKTQQGIELIRMDAKQPGEPIPFDKVKASILAELRTEYVNGKMSDRFRAIRNDPAIVVNQPAVDALVVKVDPEEMKRATQEAARRSAERRARPDRADRPVRTVNGVAPVPVPATPNPAPAAQ